MGLEMFHLEYLCFFFFSLLGWPCLPARENPVYLLSTTITHTKLALGNLCEFIQKCKFCIRNALGISEESCRRKQYFKKITEQSPTENPFPSSGPAERPSVSQDVPGHKDKP